jgi:predicted nucleotidyltransferase
MPLNKDLREFVESLNSNDVEYLIVGGFAVAWHGYPRFTADIDFFVRSTQANAEAILAALRDFGFGSLDIAPDDFTKPNQVIQLGAKPNRIDIPTSVSGLAFETAWEDRSTGNIDGVQVQFVGFDDLVRNKESTGRSKDLVDAQELKKRRAGHLG